VIADILRRLAAGETLRDREARMRCKDGSIKHVLIDSSVLFEQGRFIHTRCFTRDISDRKRAEEARARLAAIVESSQDAIISKTLDGRITSWNAAAEQLFGYRAEEAIGQPITLIVPPERQDEERTILEQLRRGERIEHYETVRVAKQGRRIDVSLTISPVHDGDGQVIGASKISRDITARKWAERRLTTQNRVTHLLAESEGLYDAARKILQTVCEHLEWQVGVLWRVEEEQALRFVELYHLPSVQVPAFEAMSREQSFEPGVGLPGRVWAAAQPVWIGDVVEDGNFPRAPVARAEGLHAALGFPILLGGKVLGVIEFFSDDIREPDPDLLEMTGVIGSQIGQYIERRAVEAALRASEAKHRLLAEAVPAMVWSNRADGSNDFFNTRWLEYTGLSVEQSRGQGWSTALHPDDREQALECWGRCLRSGEPYRHEFRVRRADGEYRWCLSQAMPMRDAQGRVLRWFGTCTDIDDRKRAEDASRFLADASAALADLTDHESTLQEVATLAVPRFADWCAVDLRDSDGGVRRLAVAHGDPVKAELARATVRKYASSVCETRGIGYVIRTGQPQWLPAVPDETLLTFTDDEDHVSIVGRLGAKSYLCVPLKSRVQVLGALTFVMAQSGRVYEAPDVRAAEDLADRAVIAIENARLLAALKEADRRKDEFLAMLAHELRNPLAPIRNAVQIFRGKGLPVPELQWATEVIDRQIQQMTRLVDDLLDVSRITRGKLALRKQLIDLETVINSAVEASRPMIEKWGHKLTITIPPRPVRLEADPTRLAQVFLNLLNNAAKYTDRGGRITLAAEHQTDHVLIRVEDNGIGIPSQMLPRVFELFAQADRSLDRAEGGLGIGLTLVQRLVEMHGGTVEARSDGPR